MRKTIIWRLKKKYQNFKPNDSNIITYLGKLRQNWQRKKLEKKNKTKNQFQLSIEKWGKDRENTNTLFIEFFNKNSQSTTSMLEPVEQFRKNKKTTTSFEKNFNFFYWINELEWLTLTIFSAKFYMNKNFLHFTNCKIFYK